MVVKKLPFVMPGPGGDMTRAILSLTDEDALEIDVMNWTTQARFKQLMLMQKQPTGPLPKEKRSGARARSQRNSHAARRSRSAEPD